MKRLWTLLACLLCLQSPDTLHAQGAVPQGVRVRIVSPDSGIIAGVGSSVQVNVLLTKVFTSALDTVIVALQSDTSELVDTQNVIAPKFVDTLFSPSVSGSSVDTFKFFFPVEPGDPVTASDGVVAQALVSQSGNTGIQKLNNVSKTRTSTLSDAETVGDGKRVGISGAAPATLSATSLEFDNTEAGATSQKTLTVTNSGTGTVPLTVGSTTSNDAFTVSPASLSLASGAEGTVTVTFAAPTDTGPQTGALTLQLAREGYTTASLNVTLSGTGVAASTQTPQPGGDSPISADIQLTADSTPSSTTSLSPRGGDTVVIEIFSTSYTNSQGVQITLEVSDPAVVASSKGASAEFPVVIDSREGNTLTMSSVVFGARKDYSGDPKLVATMTLVLSNTFSPITIKIKAIDFGDGAVDPGITFELTQPANNLISNVNVTPSHSGARITWSTLFPGTSSVVTYNTSGETTSTPVQITLETASVDHTANLTGLTAATTYEYQIASTSTSGEVSPDTRGTFTTRATPDTRPIIISNVSYTTTPSSITLTWLTNRLADTRIKIESIEVTGVGLGAGGIITGDTTKTTVTELQTTDAQGTTQHRITIDNLPPRTSPNLLVLRSTTKFFTIISRGVGLDDLIAENLMTEADVTATKAQSFFLPHTTTTSFFSSPRFSVTAGTNQATLDDRLSSVLISTHVRIFYKLAPTSGSPDAAYFNDAPSVTSAQQSPFHTIPLVNLESGKKYVARIHSSRLDVPGSQPTEFQDDFDTAIQTLTFRTHAKLDPPFLTLGPVVVPGSQQAAFVFGSDIPTTSEVVLGTTGLGGTFNTPDALLFRNFTNDGQQLLAKRHTHVIRGLIRGTSYRYLIRITNAAGQITEFNPFSSSSKPGVLAKQVVGSDGAFGTSEVDDTQLPLITRGPTVVNKTESSLTIEWDTDEVANSTVSFGTSADSLNGFQIDGEPVTTHRMTITDLNPATTYAYQIGSTDISDNGPVQGQIVLATTLAQPDITAPTYSVLPNASYTTDTRVDIEWTTSEMSNGEINFGASADNLDQFATITEFALKNGVTLANLTAGTTYFYQVSSSDLNGNGPSLSPVLSFTTLAAADTEAPTIADVAVSPTDSAAVITWTSNELANSIVQYGLTADALDNNVSDINIVTAHRIVLANLTPETTYTFLVQSNDPARNGPTSSEQATFTTAVAGSAQGPAAPAGLAARAGNGIVQLTWNAPDAGAIGLLLERAEGEGDFTALATLDPTTIYIDYSAANGTAYRYRLTAQGLFQRSGDPSAATEAATPLADIGPSAPTLFTVQGTPTSPTLVINNSTPQNEDDALTYIFHISTQANFSDVVETSPAVASGAGVGPSDPAGITAYTVSSPLTDGTTYHYRVKANDGFSDGPFFTGAFTVNASAAAFPGDLDGNRTVGFSDFLIFVGSFNKSTGEDGFVAEADLTGDGSVSFGDFIVFSSAFNKTYITGPEGSSKPVVQPEYGTDAVSKLQLAHGPSFSTPEGREVVVDVKLSDVENLKGYGLRIDYDPTLIKFLDATNSGETLLNTDGRLAEIFGTLDHNAETGELFIASAITSGKSVSGAGTLASLRFRLLDPTPQGELIGIAEALLIDDKLQANAAQNLGARLSLIPTEYALEHNFPNPFNPDTTIRYAVPDAGKVTLTVYNVLGQEIITLVNKDHQPGFYTLQWNAQDPLGRTVASGIYLYRMTAGKFARTHKMLLLK